MTCWLPDLSLPCWVFQGTLRALALSPNPGHPLKLTLASHLPGSARIRNWRCILTHAYRYLLISIDLIRSYLSKLSQLSKLSKLSKSLSLYLSISLSIYLSIYLPIYLSIYLGHLPVFFDLVIDSRLCWSPYHPPWMELEDLAVEWTSNEKLVNRPRSRLDHNPHICRNLKGLHMFTPSQASQLRLPKSPIFRSRSQCDLRGPWSVPSLWRRAEPHRGPRCSQLSLSPCGGQSDSNRNIGITGPRSPFFIIMLWEWLHFDILLRHFRTKFNVIHVSEFSWPQELLCCLDILSRMGFEVGIVHSCSMENLRKSAKSIQSTNRNWWCTWQLMFYGCSNDVPMIFQFSIEFPLIFDRNATDFRISMGVPSISQIFPTRIQQQYPVKSIYKQTQ